MNYAGFEGRVYGDNDSVCQSTWNDPPWNGEESYAGCTRHSL
jgi:hypothetical protein